jgi:hypothetical protein
MCSKKVVGRSDKLFCSVKCKSTYHRKLRKKTKLITLTIDEILHRNRSILYEIIGDVTINKTVPRMVLEKKKFQFMYHTHTHKNKQGKTYFYVYDLAWMSFSDNKILIIKTKFKSEIKSKINLDDIT